MKDNIFKSQNSQHYFQERDTFIELSKLAEVEGLLDKSKEFCIAANICNREGEDIKKWEKISKKHRNTKVN
jgi:hypothetical protein